MRRKKENIKHISNPNRDADPETDAMESEREQRFEEINGVTSSEGVGPGFDTPDEDDLLDDVATADGPVTGESITPPTAPAGRRGRARRKHRRNARMVDRQRGNHTAARSTKQI